MTVNRVILVGNMGKAIEVRTTQSGKRIGSFTLATTKKWKDKNGERKDKTSWHNISVLQDGLCGVLEQYTSKGSKLYIEGEIDYQEYEKDGQKKYITKIVANTIQLLDSKSDKPVDAHTESKQNGYQPDFTPEDMDDSIPF